MRRRGRKRRIGTGSSGKGHPLTWPGESAKSRDASELMEEDGEVGSTLVWISVGWQGGAGPDVRWTQRRKGRRF